MNPAAAAPTSVSQAAAAPPTPLRKVILAVMLLAIVVGVLFLARGFLDRFKHSLRLMVRQEVELALAADAIHLARERDRIAAQETAIFINQHMAKVPAFPDAFALLDHSLKVVDPKLNGLYCEFGVYTGTTINYIASKTDREVHGFDSFEGLPETWRTGFGEGTFKMTGLPPVRPNVKLHKGWFNESLPVWAKTYSGPLAFMHLDADLYSSTKTVFDLLGKQVVPGTVIQFDEYFNYPGWQDGEYRAFRELVEARQVKFEYIGYTTGGNAQQVAVKILAVSKPD